MNKKKYIDILKEIKDYFSSRQDEEYMKYNDHPLASIEKLLNDDEPAPWDEEYLSYIREGKR